MKKLAAFTFLAFILFSYDVKAQIPEGFVFGNDLSYVNQMEDCGAVYKEGGEPKDPFQIFADHGTNLVRVRLWVDPSWWQTPLDQPEGVKPYYNDLVDVKETIQRAKDAGMQVMLGIHYSDFWADPGRQLIPRKWLEVANDLETLKDSVYKNTTKVLTELDSEGLMPEYVKVGNENNAGILRHIPEEGGYEPASSVSDSWARHAELYNAAISAIREVGATASVNPKIALHFSNDLSGQVWNYQNMINNGVTDFDVIGISYYYAWHGDGIQELENTISDLASTFSDYEVMVVETGYLWSQQNYDGLGNIINDPDPDYLPVSPNTQLEYMVDFTKAVMNGGGMGVIFWEPAWVSTPCRTPWGTGSSHDHVAFFDPENTNFMENGGGRWTESQWYEGTVKVTFKVDIYGVDVSNGVYITGDFTGDGSWEILPMTDEGNNLYFYITYLQPGTTGAYYFLNGNDWEARETVPSECIEWYETDRGYDIPDEDVVYSYQWGSCEEGIPNREEITVNVTFKVDMSGRYTGDGVYITGHMTGDPWQLVQMTEGRGNVFSKTFELHPGETGAFHFLNAFDENARETVPMECADWWDSDRGYTVPDEDTIYLYAWASCEASPTVTSTDDIVGVVTNNIKVYPNPSKDILNIDFKGFKAEKIEVLNVQGRLVKVFGDNTNIEVVEDNTNKVTVDIGFLKSGVYLLRLTNDKKAVLRKVIKE